MSGSKRKRANEKGEGEGAEKRRVSALQLSHGTRKYLPERGKRHGGRKKHLAGSWSRKKEARIKGH